MTPFKKDHSNKKDWILIDAENLSVGRLAAYISMVLRGKISQLMENIMMMETLLS